MTVTAGELGEVALTAQELEELQERIALEAGAPVGLTDPALLDAARSQPLRAVGGVLLYETAARRATALAHALLTSRCFESCNRRTTVAAIELWMDREHYSVLCDREQLIVAVDALAEGRTPREEFARWLARQSRPKLDSNPGSDPGVRRIATRASYDPPENAFPPRFLTNPSELGRDRGL
jgi:prophage maintenance system killer protein